MRVLTACVLVLAMAGCGGGDSVFPQLDTGYGSVLDLKDAVEAAGCPCYSWRVSDEVPADAVEQAHCTPRVLFTLYPDALSAQRAADETVALLAQQYGLASVFLVGANWTINCSDEQVLCSLLGDALGGRVQVTAP